MRTLSGLHSGEDEGDSETSSWKSSDWEESESIATSSAAKKGLWGKQSNHCKSVSQRWSLKAEATFTAFYPLAARTEPSLIASKNKIKIRSHWNFKLFGLWTFTRMSDAFHQPKVVASCDCCVGPVPQRYTTTHGQVWSTTTFTYKEEWSSEKARLITVRSKQESTCRCRSK